jgi:hypothetical protein
MRYRSSTTAIPLPFATAGVGLCLSYVFSSRLNAPIATVSGFLLGVIALYLSGRGSAEAPFDSRHARREIRQDEPVTGQKYRG